MRAYVFTDRSLTRQAGQFVWLEIDTEKAKNAALKKRLGVQALPTFFILDPSDERVALRWVGGATAAQLQRILADGGATVAESFGRARPGASSPTDQALARADRLYGAGDYVAAAKAYQEA